jgi:hypothetical protein
MTASRYHVRPLLARVPREAPPFLPLPSEGLAVQPSQYYDRLALAGDVEILEIAEPAPIVTAPEAEAEAKPKARAKQ